MEVKIQHYTFEEHEFDIFIDPSPEQVLELFNEFDLSAEFIKMKSTDVPPCFIIEKNSNLVRILPASDELLDLLLFPFGSKSYYRKRGNKQELSLLIHKLLENDFHSILEDCIEMNSPGRIEHIKKSEKIIFNYVFSFQKILWRLAIGIALLCPIYFFNNPGKTMIYITFILLLISFFIFIYIQYLISNYGYNVSISRGNDIFKINGKTFDKKEISTIEYYHSNVNNPVYNRRPDNDSNTIFSNTAYMHISFINGTTIILNTLTIDRESLDVKFRNQKINMHLVSIPYIRKFK